MAEMTFTQKLAAYNERLQKIQVTQVRLDESAKQKTREATEAASLVEQVIGTRDFAVAEKKVQEHYERLDKAFRELDQRLSECEEFIQQENLFGTPAL